MPSAADDMARLVAEQGGPLVLRVTVSPEAYDPATGTTTPAVQRDDEITGMLLAGGSFQVRGGLVAESTPRAVFAVADVLTMPDTTARVIDPTPLPGTSTAPDGTVTYEVNKVRLRTLGGAPVLVVCELAG